MSGEAVFRRKARGVSLGMVVVTDLLSLVAGACGDDPTGVSDGMEVGSIQVGPAGGSVVVGDTVRFTAVALTADGSVVGGTSFQWSTGDDERATIQSRGATALVTALAAGNVQIFARAGGRTGWVTAQATIRVKTAGTSVQGYVWHLR